MVELHIITPGDSWTNVDEVMAKLATIDPTEPVVLNFNHEGPSIVALGIVDFICSQTGRHPNTISTSKYSNQFESADSANSTYHFLSQARIYWTPVEPVAATAQPFGYFMGRRTFARGRIVYDLYHQGQSLLSVMNTATVAPWVKTPPGINLEKSEDWLTADMIEWLQTCPITSLDGLRVGDQYVKRPQTNSGILKFYNQFCCEIVAETFTLGRTFFPTEKTIRPIMAAKPFLVYGPRNFLRHLRKLGFKTYSSCWDESYDNLEGPARWHQIKEIIPTVVVDDRALEIARYNRQRLAQMIGSQNF